jgi:nucleotide-binding universal stress UspA family protein
MKLLIACGPITDVQAIAADLHAAGLPAAVQAVVLSVADLLPVPASPDTADLPAAVRRARLQSARELEQAAQVAERAAASLRAAFPDWTITVEAQADAPAWAIVKKAEAWRPDVIVVCSDDRSRLQRIVLGSVSQTVLTHAPGSVRIVRPRRSAAGAERLLIGVDGSPGADAAVAAVAARTWQPGAEVRLVTALDVTLANMLGFTDDANDERDAASRFMHRAATDLGAVGLTVVTALIEGNPKQVLVEEAERWNADCLYIGARGLRGIERFRLGSVSAAVAARTPCTVEVVRT